MTNKSPISQYQTILIGASGSITTTPSIANGTLLIGASGSSILSSKSKYIVLGEEVEVNGNKDLLTSLYVSMINLHGKAFYDEVKKQGVNFPKEIENYLEKALISLERGRKIDSIL